MNRNVKNFVLVLMVLLLACTSVFAKGKKGNSDNKGPEGRPEMMGFENVNLIGTVVSVDEDEAILVVKDADGNEVKIHCNEFTRIMKLGAKEFKKNCSEISDETKEMPEKPDEEMAAGKPMGDRPMGEPKDAPNGPNGDMKMPPKDMPKTTISDIKVGSSVAVQKFNTSTQVIEAAHIIVKEGK
ncbi:MAG: hypothetical protein K6G52_01415 [Treponemataceae bacterium]|nr:hypothetical protein [Treponemataceae bacterium]